MTHYSQNDEQEVVLDFFAGRIGRFLEIGAYDGMGFSNTRALVELGWSGVQVEPDPHNLVNLIRAARSARGHIEIVCAAVAPGEGLALMRIDETPDRAWASTIEPEQYHGVWKPLELKVYVPTIRIGRLLSPHSFHFVSIDAEWMDFAILKDADVKLGGCELLCIETRGPEERVQMKQYLTEFCHFTIHHETNENIMARKTP